MARPYASSRGLSGAAAAWGGWPALHGLHAQAAVGIAELQASTGLPWWATLGVAATGLKVATLPAQVVSARAVARLAPLWHAARRNVLKRGGDGEANKWNMSATWSEFSRLRVAAAAPHPSVTLVGLVVRLPAFVVVVGAMRRMAELYFPGFEDGGALWFRNLCEPVRAMPQAALLSGACGLGVYLTLASGVASGSAFGRLWHTGGQVLGLGVLATGPFLPPAVYCYWLANLAAGAAERLALRAPRVQHALGIISGPPQAMLEDAPRLIRVAAKATAAGDLKAAQAALSAAKAAARSGEGPTRGLALFGAAAVSFKERELEAAAMGFQEAADEFRALAANSGGVKATTTTADGGDKAAGDAAEAVEAEAEGDVGSVEAEREYALLQMQRSLVHVGLTLADRRKELSNRALDAAPRGDGDDNGEDDTFDARVIAEIAEAARGALAALEEAAGEHLPSKDFRALALLTMAELKKDMGDQPGSMETYKRCAMVDPSGVFLKRLKSGEALQ